MPYGPPFTKSKVLAKRALDTEVDEIGGLVYAIPLPLGLIARPVQYCTFIVEVGVQIQFRLNLSGLLSLLL